jgi:response regulator RpfG family c-di-GMP phosphodiesterase
MKAKILCVDDDANILAGYQRTLRKQFCIDTVLSGADALQALSRQGPYAIIVADMNMPGMNGIELLTKVQEAAPDTVRMMLTGNADQKTAVEAVNKGHIFRFLNKPCPCDVLGWALEAGLQHYERVTGERELLENTLGGAIKLLTEVLAITEASSFRHAEKMRDYARGFTQSFKAGQNWQLEVAAMLSPIGFIMIPPSVVAKARAGESLSAAEQTLLSRLPETGATLLAHIPRMEGVGEIIRYQAKNFDGTGFPQDGVGGENIPLGARILRVLADLIQLENQGISKARALELMQQRVGAYDPRVLDAAFASFDIYLSAPTSLAPAGLRVNLSDLCVGQLLLSSAESQDGVVVVTAGTRISPMILQRLKNFAQLTGLKEPIHVEAQAA